MSTRSSCGFGRMWFLTLFILMSMTVTSSWATEELTLHGPQRYERHKGAPTVYTETFRRCEPSGLAYLRIWNGDDKDSRITAARITVNDTLVVKDEEFKQWRPYFEVPIAVAVVNELKIELKSGDYKVPAFLDIEVVGRDCDVTPPVISAPRPAVGALLNTARPEIGINYSDDESGASGIDTSSVRLTVDGADVTGAAAVTASGVSYTPSSALPEGEHDIYITVADNAANLSEFRWSFTTDTIAPVIAVASHADGVWLNTPAITLAGNWTDERGETPAITVNGTTATVTAGVFSLPVALVEGSNVFEAVATDAAGNSASAVITINLDTVAPVISVDAPVDNVWVNTLTVAVSGSLSEEFSQVTINAQPVTVTGSSFAAAVAVAAEGSNALAIVATDRAGNQGSATLNVNRDTIAPTVIVTSHAAGDWLNTPSIALAGTVSEEFTTVTVNSVTAAVVGSSFSLNDVDLVEGVNSFSVNVVDRAGNSGSTALTLNLDTVPPTVIIDTPPTGSLTNQSSTDIIGHADEPLLGADINGSAATLGENNSFSSADFPLAIEGDNTLTATVSDRAGNSGSASVVVERDTIPPQPPVLDALTTPTNVANVVIAGSAEPLSTVRIFGQSPTDLEPQLLAAVPCGADGRFSLGDIVLLEGQSSFRADATDPAGNRGATSALVAIVLDTVPPVVTISAPLNDAWFNTATVTVTGSVDEALQSLTLNGQNIVSTDLTFSGVAQLLLDGPHNLVVTAVDPAGNAASAAVSVNRDTVPPVISITAPRDDLLTNQGSVDLTGSVNEPVTAVTVNSVAATVVGNDFSRLQLDLIEGANLLTVTAVDRAGNSSTATVTVKRDSTPPAAPVLAQPATPTNAAVSALSGSCEAGAEVVISMQPPDGGIVTLATLSAADADGDGEGTFALNDIALTAEGDYLFSAVATDAAGNSSPAATVSIVRDITAPLITVSSPLDNSISEELEIDIVGSVDDPSAALTIDGVVVALGVDGSFSYRKTLQYGENGIILLATDVAGNSGSAGLTVHADSTPPEITIVTPVNGTITAAGQVTLSGGVNEPITALTLGGQPVTFTGQTFSTVVTLAEGGNQLALSALDRAGNIGSAAVGVTRDSTPPSLTLSVPEQGAAGSNVQLALSAADSFALSLIEIAAAGAPLWSENTTLNARDKSLTYTLAPDAVPGTVVAFSARAVDRVGNIATATGALSVIAGVAKPGYLQGEVYHDHSGLRLADATVTVTDGNGTAVTVAVTGTDGGYFVELPVGSYAIRISAAGFTAVDRTVTIASGRNSQVRDARLTPLTSLTQAGLTVDLTGGSTSFNPTPDQVDGVSMALTVPPEAIVDAVDLKVTALSNQGLAAALPLGRSPLGAFEVRQYLPATAQEVGPETFALPVTLDLSWQTGWTVPSAAAVTLLRYDFGERTWTTVAAATLAATGNALTTQLPGPGQYALVTADGDSDPDRVSDVSVLDAVGRVVPSAAPPSVDLRAVGEIVFTRPQAVTAELVSGTVVLGKVSERFDLIDGNVALPSAYTQDLVLYQRPCLTNPGAGAVSAVNGTVATPELRAAFPVTPSKQYSIIELLMGKVGIAVYGVDTETASGVMVGSDGARLADTDGNVLDIPAGALSQTVPVSTRTVSGTAALVPDGFALLSAVAIDLTRQTLNVAATLTVPAPANFDATRPVVIALPVESNNAIQLQLVALGRSSGTSIASDGTLAGLNLPGIVTSGNYYLLQANGPLGYLTGNVVNPAGQAYPNALVTTSGHGLASVSSATGGYRLALAAGNATVSALDPVLNDSGSASVTVGANSVSSQNITIQPQPPQVVETFPINGQGGVEPSASPVITFSEGVQKDTVTGGGLTLTHSGGTRISGAFSFSPDQRIVTFYPATTLKSEANYTLSLGAAIRDLQGYALKDPQTVSFFIRDVTPPVPPPAGAISATFPDAEGYVTVTATQGSAENDVTVLLINNESGAIVGISPNADGSFSAKISAQLGDEVEIVLMDGAGNQTTISYLTFKAPDGRYLVTAKGGKVEGEGGSLLEIPDGALVGPAVIKVTQVAEEELPYPVSEPGNFIAAFKVDTGGLPFNREVDLSIPLPDGFSDDAFPFLVRPRTQVNADGSEEQVFEVVDTVKRIDGRLTTASWPFDGILEQGLYLFMYADGKVGYPYPIVVYGTAYHDLDGQAGYLQGTDKPVPGAAIRSQGADSYRAYADEKGRYATFGWSVKDVCPQFTVTGIHPLTANRVTHTVSTCQAELPQKIDFKLAEKDTVIPDVSVPEISINLQAVAGQTGKTVLPGGLVNVDKNYKILISVADQSLDANRVTLTSATSSDGVAFGASRSVAVSAVGTPHRLDREVRENEPPVMQHSFEGSFNPTEKQYYRFTVNAIDQSGLDNERSIRLRVVDMDNLSDHEGTPIVTVIPDNEATNVSINARIFAVFNEPVANVKPETFKLYSCTEKDGKHDQCSVAVPTDIYVDISEEQLFRANLVPKTNLSYDQWYKITLNEIKTEESDIENDIIRDDQLNADSGGVYLPVDTTVSYFKTKQPRQFELTSGEFKKGRKVVIYEYGPNTYAIVAAGTEGWHIVDISDRRHPKKIFSQNLSNGGVSWDIRGVAVNQQNGLLALTDHSHWLGTGQQFGYVRFYDFGALLASIADNPTGIKAPIGGQKLAESYSAIPGRVVMSGKHAFIVSVNSGLQVVDIDAACKPHEADDNSAIVGTYGTNAAGYGHANDIQLYLTGRALLTTGSGYMVLLDVSNPTRPAPFAGFKPDNLAFTRANAVADYLYTGTDGFEQLMDLAVVGTRYGQVKTVDISNPTNPVVLGTVRQGDEDAVIFTRDISIDKTFGLAYISTFGTIKVVDIKDPANPSLLATLTQLPVGESNPASGADLLQPLGDIGDMIQHDGWIYLADAVTGFKGVELVPVQLKLECGEREEALKGVSRTFCNDYYPALGGKRIRLQGLNNNLQKYTSASGAKVVHVAPVSGVTVSPADGASFDDEGYATFTITAPNAKDLIQLDFELRPPQPVGSLVPPKTSRTSVVLKVRDNSNVTFGEVLDGEAVFVADYYSNGRKSEGKYPDGKKVREIDERDRKFIYVQELLNQVVSRKRNLTEPYTLTDEDGKYGSGGTKAVKAFRDNFGVGNSTVAFEKSTDGNISYKTEDNTSAIIRMLSKDYGVRAGVTTEIATSNVVNWMHKVVDRQTLAGKDLKLHGVAETPDYAIGSDAGLYELYKNVVERFNQYMIDLAESYANNGAPDGGYSWISRDGDLEGKAVSYSYGGRRTVSEFKKTVSRFKAPKKNEIKRKTVNDIKGFDETDAKTKYFIDYRGKLADTVPTGNQDENIAKHGKIEAGGPYHGGEIPFKWPGLLNNEYFYNEAYGKFDSPYYFQYWAGVDCEGLVLSSLRYAKEPEKYAEKQELSEAMADAISSISLGETCIDDCAPDDKGNCTRSRCDEWSSVTSDNSLGNVNVRKFFKWTEKGNIHYWRKEGKDEKDTTRLIKKGDVVHYGGHITIVYSERHGVSEKEGNYDIIHASGIPCTDEEEDGSCKQGHFSRKVLITKDIIPGMSSPKGFGRIKLWE